MLLEGSCHCGAVRFSVEAYAPVPYLRCYCSICRKTQGGGGYAINLGAKAATLKVTGAKNIKMFHARIDGRRSTGERRFCGKCGSALWVQDKRWPDLVHPFASVIDTKLPEPPERVHILLGSMANWVQPDIRPGDKQYREYPPDSLEEWHRAHGLLDEVTVPAAVAKPRRKRRAKPSASGTKRRASKRSMAKRQATKPRTRRGTPT